MSNEELTEKPLEEVPHGRKKPSIKSNTLTLLRSIFTKPEYVTYEGGIDAYLLPRVDPHQSEYIADRYCRVEYVSGFTGSNAFVLVTKKEALLWTDGRYFEQANAELSDEWTLMKEAIPGSINFVEWILRFLPNESAIGFDPKLFTFEQVKNLTDKLCHQPSSVPDDGNCARPCNYKLVPIAENLVDVIWGAEQPAEQIRKIICLDASVCGEDSPSKISRLRATLVENKCDVVVLTALDEIAWLLNIRGFDIPFNSVAFAILIVSIEEIFLFIDQRKLSSEVSHYFANFAVQIFPYENAEQFIAKFHRHLCMTNSQHQFFVPGSVNYAIASLIDAQRMLMKTSPVRLMKCYKNEKELEGMRNASIRDSAAHIQFLLWIRRELELGHHVTELMAAKQMYYYRSKLSDFVSLSFETISAVGENAAMPHYHLTPESSKRLVTELDDDDRSDNESMDTVYLIDSGGQYRDGTTDVTRTIYVGSTPPGEHLKRMFTLVLRGHIDTATLVFPAGINAIRIESQARRAMWENGYDFPHGVGHGIGHFLNVHEYPPFVGHRLYAEGELIQKGMVYTIEPGYYEKGKFGIRIENAYETVAVDPKNLMSKSTEFLTHSPLTYVPIQKSLIDKDLLDAKHILWINDYHNKCLEVVGKCLQEYGFQSEYNFLAEACAPF